MRKVALALVLAALALPVLAQQSFTRENFNPGFRQPNGDYKARRQKLAAKAGDGVVVLFAGMEEEGPNALYGFRQDENFFYLTGLRDPGAALLIAAARPAQNGTPARPYTEILFLAKRNLTQEKWTGPKLNADTADVRDVTGFDQVLPLDAMRDALVRILPQPRALVLSDLAAWDAHSSSTPALQWLRRSNSFPNYIAFDDVKPLLAALRVQKDAGEMAIIRHAVAASMAAHRRAAREMRPGLRESDIQTHMQHEFGQWGCPRPAYAPIVGTGFNSTVLHYSENARTIEPGDLVVMDVGAECGMYAADITRTLPAGGKFTARQREVYDVVLGAMQAAIASYQPGKSGFGRSAPNSMHKVAMDYIDSHGKDLKGQSLGRYFIHGLSHYVGLNVHDPGDTNVLLQPGMVFTIEPGIYIPDEKLGVRIEDMFWIDPQGRLVNLTQDLPRTAEEMEGLMQSSTQQ
jgi:Xaa-Pro aminopeptidase